MVTLTFYRLPRLLQNLLGTYTPPRGPWVYLTFDDGPSAFTSQITQVLEAYGAGATFFWLAGKLPPKIPQIPPNCNWGTHGKNHLRGWKAPKAAYHNLLEGYKILSSTLDRVTPFVRPPYGQLPPYALPPPLRYILWDWMAYDFATPHWVQRTLDHLSEGDVIVLHECANVLEGLPCLIKNLLQRGWEIRALSDPTPTENQAYTTSVEGIQSGLPHAEKEKILGRRRALKLPKYGHLLGLGRERF